MAIALIAGAEYSTFYLYFYLTERCESYFEGHWKKQRCSYWTFIKFHPVFHKLASNIWSNYSPFYVQFNLSQMSKNIQKNGQCFQRFRKLRLEAQYYNFFFFFNFVIIHFFIDFSKAAKNTL